MLITAVVSGLSLPSSYPSLFNCLLIARTLLLPCSSCLSRCAIPGMMCTPLDGWGADPWGLWLILQLLAPLRSLCLVINNDLKRELRPILPRCCWAGARAVS